MTAIKTSNTIFGIMYAIVDQNSNEVTLRQGLPKFPANTPTVLLMANAVTTRLSQANATAWGANGPTTPATLADADGNILVFGNPVSPDYIGGYSQGAANGTRLFFGGTQLDLTASNLSDLGTPLVAFASSGVLS